MSTNNPDDRLLRKMEREWEDKKEKAEEAYKNINEEIRKMFREHRSKIAQEALENIHKPSGSHPFSKFRGEGNFAGDVTAGDVNRRDDE